MLLVPSEEFAWVCDVLGEFGLGEDSTGVLMDDRMRGVSGIVNKWLSSVCALLLASTVCLVQLLSLLLPLSISRFVAGV